MASLTNIASLSLDDNNDIRSIEAIEYVDIPCQPISGQITDVQHREYMLECYHKAIQNIHYADIGETPPPFDVLYHKYCRRGKWSAVIQSENRRIRFKRQMLQLRSSPRAYTTPTVTQGDLVSKLAQLTVMHKDGDLTHDEFKLAKQKILKD